MLNTALDHVFPLLEPLRNPVTAKFLDKQREKYQKGLTERDEDEDDEDDGDDEEV